ncbi:MAG: ABC transporter ATP-binding protein [Acidobacteria bacterium]|nr:ABC transporter ATP-binding protein [Acidobacteriota bacterium]
MTSVRLERISAHYGAARVLDDITLAIETGELMALVGPSGCGKTTILKILAGLLTPSEGEVFFEDRLVTNVSAERRGAAMVFQKPLLFPYLSVGENVAFGLHMRKVARDETRRRVREALEWVHLAGYESRRPSQLSGGQEQRVTLARALVTQPKLLLLDEPFSALDESLRAGMRLLVRELQQRLGITTVFVTHDQMEAAAIADRIALVFDGRLEQCAAPRDFYTAPATLRAARFFGWTAISANRGTIAFRPESVLMDKASGVDSSDESFDVAVVSFLDLGTRLLLRVRFDTGEELELELDPSQTDDRRALSPGARIRLRVPHSAQRRFP